ncbi:hypothetical protein F4803DRAFT_512327 [Xylaria telfairii]|nr:hypothetical protein F4803DRAFT_512327 [Xylaria telfairii]
MPGRGIYDAQQAPLSIDSLLPSNEPAWPAREHQQRPQHGQSGGFQGHPVYDATGVGSVKTVATGSRGAQTFLWRRLNAIWMFGWVAEVFGCVVANASLAAIVIILLANQGKYLPRWPLGITLNALVSIIVVLLKGAVSLVLANGISQLKWQWFSQQPRPLIDMEQFDSASRGPWGSFLFLFRTGTRSAMKGYLLNMFAKFAAFLFLLSFAIDPFTQQIVHFIPCQHESNTITGGVARSNSYVFDNSTLSIPGQGPWIDEPMTIAINTGLINPPKNPSTLVDIDCPTGNCTLPAFSTIAMCHVCHDIRDLIIPKSLIGGYIVGKEKNITLSQYQQMDTSADELFDDMMVDFRIIATGEPNDNNKTTAFSCQLGPCVRTIQPTIKNSLLYETETSRTPIRQNPFWVDEKQSKTNQTAYVLASSGDGQGILVPSPLGGAATPFISPTAASCNTSAVPAPGMKEVALSNIYPLPEDPSRNRSTYISESCVWSVDAGSISAMQGDLVRNLDGLYVQSTATIIYANSLARRVYNNGTVDWEFMNRFMGAVSDSMTATMRGYGGSERDSNGEWARGPAIEQTTCVAIRWAWISYPVALVVLSTLWLWILIWQSPRGEASTRGWKSSSLAVLMAGIGGDKILEAAENAGGRSEKLASSLYDMSRSQMEQLASLVDAQLVKDNEGKATFL